jgi:hypothetical protein
VKWHRKSEEENPAERAVDPEADAEPTVERPAEPEELVETPFAGTSVASGGGSFVGIPRARGNWDLVVTREAPDLTGADELGFVVAEDGDIFMDSQLPDGDVTPLAEAIEQQIQPPYRAYGSRQEGDRWAVAARAVKLGRFQATGDEIELTVREGERELLVDGRKSFAGVPELEAIGREASEDFFVRATRVEDDLWEVTVNPL